MKRRVETNDIYTLYNEEHISSSTKREEKKMEDKVNVIEKICFIILGMFALSLNWDLSDVVDLVFFVPICIGTFTMTWITGIDLGRAICRLANPRR